MAKAPIDKNKKQVKVKRPTPLKRDDQDEKRRMRNRAVKSQVRTAIRAYEEILNGGDATAIQASLSAVHSELDRAAQKGVFKANKTSRLKSRMQARQVA